MSPCNHSNFPPHGSMYCVQCIIYHCPTFSSVLYRCDYTTIQNNVRFDSINSNADMFEWTYTKMNCAIILLYQLWICSTNFWRCYLRIPNAHVSAITMFIVISLNFITVTKDDAFASHTRSRVSISLPGTVMISQCRLTSIGMPIIWSRQSYDRLMGIPVAGKTILKYDIETGPWSL